FPPVTPEAALSEIAELVELITDTDAALVQPDSAFVADLGVDSLSMVEILEGLEQNHGLVLTPAEVAGIKKVSHLLKLLVARAE
ncbi:MAG TPA: phosphopantetheine-binding protein, partial [Marmoricola sp.]|nr:phosphopantetheine-binding protein [Marmoricola sp.]